MDRQEYILKRESERCPAHGYKSMKVVDVYGNESSVVWEI